MSIHPKHIFAILVLCFAVFSFSIYVKPAMAASGASESAMQGRLVWQKFNCQTCHQLYGLGGYLGPDLTNVYSTPGKGEPLIRAALNAPTAPMPAYHLSEQEADQLIAFFKAMDASGIGDPRNFSTHPTGMIDPK